MRRCLGELDTTPEVVAGEDRPIGSPVLASRRDRFSVWVAEHRWAVSLIRVAAGLGLVGVMTLVAGAHFHLGQVIAFVIGAGLGGEAGEREKERGDSVIETLFSVLDLPAPPESLPKEFAGYFHQPPDPRMDGRYFRPR
jgi:hypothetical protein